MDPQQLIKRLPEGSMIFARFKTDINLLMETGFLIRESPKEVAALGRNPPILIRAACLERNGVFPVLVMMKFKQLYSCWFNYHDPHSQEEFHDMTIQEKLKIVFFTPDISKSVVTNNHVSNVFVGAKEKAKKRAWSNRGFEAARDSIYQEYPTEESLWEAINV